MQTGCPQAIRFGSYSPRALKMSETSMSPKLLTFKRSTLGRAHSRAKTEKEFTVSSKVDNVKSAANKNSPRMRMRNVWLPGRALKVGGKQSTTECKRMLSGFHQTLALQDVFSRHSDGTTMAPCRWPLLKISACHALAWP